MTKKRGSHQPGRRKRSPKDLGIPADLWEWIHLLPGFDPLRDAEGCTFDADAARDAIRFFETCLTHVKGPKGGQPFLLMPSQKGLVANIFGWKRADGTRRFREVFYFVGRKNGKSILAAGIALYLLLSDHEWGPEIYSIASDQDQAMFVFGPAAEMVRKDEAFLGKWLQVFDGNKTIACVQNNGFYRASTSTPHSKHGGNAHGVINDEYHAQKSDELIEVMMTSTGARLQPLILHTTTAGYDQQSGCYKKYRYACQVRDGLIRDPRFLPAIYELATEDDWTDERNWPKANPNLGVSVQWDFLRAEVAKAQALPSYENTVRRLYFNQWTQQSVRWLPMDRWRKCAGEVDLDELKGRHCFAALDLASTTDLCALVLLFPPRTGVKEKPIVVPFFWVPEENARLRALRDGVDYLTWIREGWIEATPGDVTDYDVIRQRINELREWFVIDKLAIDPWNATQLATQLMADGFEVAFFRQGYKSMNEPSKRLEVWVIGKGFVHGAHPVLDWMADNVAITTDPAASIKPCKKTSTERIDGIVALVMAIGLTIGDEGPSVYEQRGVIEL